MKSRSNGVKFHHTLDLYLQFRATYTLWPATPRNTCENGVASGERPANLPGICPGSFADAAAAASFDADDGARAPSTAGKSTRSQSA